MWNPGELLREANNKMNEIYFTWIPCRARYDEHGPGFPPSRE